MIKSMTAYARSAKTDGTLDVTVEIRSYNSRHLDMVLRLPHIYSSLEEKIKARIARTLERGRIEVSVQIKDESEEAHGFEVNDTLAKAYQNALLQLKNILNIADPVSLALMAGAGGIIKPAEFERDMEKYWQVVEACLVETLTDLDSMRQREGAFIARDFTRRLDYVENCIDQIEQSAEALPHHYKKKLETRIAELTNGLIEIDPDRIAQEAAILADRSDISEEIVRSRSHIEQFRKIMASGAPAGRKLNFLVQEFNREFNTMGAKAALANVSHLTVDLKSELEKIREQIQNIE